MAVNWCTSCKCVLANEEVVGGVCERCHSEVVRKVKSQWMLKITEYAERLINDLDLVDYPDRVKAQQKNWIGRSTGAEVDFSTTTGDTLTIYTTRPDTLYGATYMVISPEHPIIEKWADKLTNIDEIRSYQYEASKKSDFERTEVAKDKTGVKLQGVEAINPVNGKQIPIFISDYVLVSYGTGAIMAVPAHDTRDWEFAKKFDLPIIEVVKGGNVQEEAFTDCATGIMVNSGILDGLTVDEAKKKSLSSSQKRKLDIQRSIISFVTGFFLVRDIGANLFRLYIALVAEQLHFLKVNFHLSFQMLNHMSQQITANLHLQLLIHG